MIKSFVLTIFSIVLIFQSTYSQQSTFTPTNHNAPFFNGENASLIGISANNYGIHIGSSLQKNNKILCLSFQQNYKDLRFDPLKFDRYSYRSEKTYQTNYIELSTGYNFNSLGKKISLIGGFGTQMTNASSTLFLQFDWVIFGTDHSYKVGTTLRSSYIVDQHIENFLVLEPVLQGKLALKDLRLVHQFGYCFLFKSGNSPAPLMSLGIEYNLPFHN